MANTESLRKEIQNVRSEVYKLTKDKGKIKKEDAAEPVSVKTSDIDKDLMDSLEIRTRNLVHRVNKLVAKTDDLDAKVSNITYGGKAGGSNLLSKISLFLSVVAIAIAAQ